MHFCFFFVCFYFGHSVLLHTNLDSFVLGIVKGSREILLLGVYDPFLCNVRNEDLFHVNPCYHSLCMITTLVYHSLTKVDKTWCMMPLRTPKHFTMRKWVAPWKMGIGAQVCLPTCACLCSCCSGGFLCMIWLLSSSCCLFSRDGLREVSGKGQISPNQWSKTKDMYLSPNGCKIWT